MACRAQGVAPNGACTRCGWDQKARKRVCPRCGGETKAIARAEFSQKEAAVSGMVLLGVGWMFGAVACLALGSAYVTLRNLIEAANVSVRCVACDHEVDPEHGVVREREAIAAKVTRHRLQALGAGLVAVGATAGWLMIVAPKFKEMGKPIGGQEAHALSEDQIAEQVARLPDEQALIALIRSGADSVPALAAALANDDASVRKSAARALESLAPADSETAVPALAQALADEDLNVRWTAIDALAAYGADAKAALPALERASAGKEPAEQFKILEAKGRIMR